MTSEIIFDWVIMEVVMIAFLWIIYLVIYKHFLPLLIVILWYICGSPYEQPISFPWMGNMGTQYSFKTGVEIWSPQVINWLQQMNDHCVYYLIMVHNFIWTSYFLWTTMFPVCFFWTYQCSTWLNLPLLTYHHQVPITGDHCGNMLSRYR